MVGRLLSSVVSVYHYTSANISEMVRDSDIVTMDNKQEMTCVLLNSDAACDLE